MKVLPPSCLQLPSAAVMDRIPLPLPFSPDLLWRYPLSFPGGQQNQQQSQFNGSSSQQPSLDLKTHLPSSLASDPRHWSREDVLAFLRWCEREFDLPRFDADTFQMNGKALCLLTKTDLNERAPGAGDVLHNVLHMLSKEAQNQAVAAACAAAVRALPSSPVTPTARLAYGPWQLDLHSLQGHLAQAGNSVTLSPAPSTDSQQGSPQHHTAAAEQQTAAATHFLYRNSDNESEEETYRESSSPRRSPDSRRPPAVSVPPPLSPKESTLSPTTPTLPFSPGLSPGFRGAREFFPSDASPTPEPNTNGRLLWDFLQQLLNDPAQRYTSYIAWKSRDTGVFKIVDPAGLAKLWGIQKNHLSMNYDKMSRALRYYYRVNILRKVQGERHCYQFLRNPSELKNIKNISLLRQQVAASQQPSSPPGRSSAVKMEAADYSDMPTDLSMEGPTDLSSRCPPSDLLELRWGKPQDDAIKSESSD
ncbi:ets DNA-binding protein pokkuri isoform X2 [Neocloeon triangulifer]|nr:ets DNA-binding protein pokkuri isoform X2 [Neocloeon triangulifer]XP_059474010.1 ets DNA-binding protein pokkuri isoform X2 [Neocloeon triangulifer]